jgi:hypothetical protein
VSTQRYVDAHETDNNATGDSSLVLRTLQNNNTQRWRLRPFEDGTYTIEQVSSGLFVDFHESDNNATGDFSLVLRPPQNNNTQRWRLKPVPLLIGTYTIQQVKSRLYVDAHETDNNATGDWTLVTRPEQNNNTQRWLIEPPR